mmetsp:Transcript_18335/g.56013  ORF Transcript_18335/g.56013 Transcript_18335/m.56013 type:complete len:294 (+) Transcript_18335:843-1724(+)
MELVGLAHVHHLVAHREVLRRAVHAEKVAGAMNLRAHAALHLWDEAIGHRGGGDDDQPVVAVASDVALRFIKLHEGGEGGVAVPERSGGEETRVDKLHVNVREHPLLAVEAHLLDGGHLLAREFLNIRLIEVTEQRAVRKELVDHRHVFAQRLAVVDQGKHLEEALRARHILRRLVAANLCEREALREVGVLLDAVYGADVLPIFPGEGLQGAVALLAHVHEDGAPVLVAHVRAQRQRHQPLPLAVARFRVAAAHLVSLRLGGRPEAYPRSILGRFHPEAKKKKSLTLTLTLT